MIWGAPLLIVIELGAVMWIGTHELDPYRPIDRISRNEPLPPHKRPLTIEAVSLN